MIKLRIFMVNSEQTQMNRHTLMTLKKIKIDYTAEIKREGQVFTEYFKKLTSQKVA